MTETVGARIRLARERAVLSQELLEARLRALGTPITRAAISRLEAGKALPRPSTLHRLAPALGVTAAWLARGDVAGNGPPA